MLVHRYKNHKSNLQKLYNAFNLIMYNKLRMFYLLQFLILLKNYVYQKYLLFK